MITYSIAQTPGANNGNRGGMEGSASSRKFGQARPLFSDVSVAKLQLRAVAYLIGIRSLAGAIARNSPAALGHGVQRAGGSQPQAMSFSERFTNTLVE